MQNENNDLISREYVKAKMFDIPKPKEGSTFWDGVDTVGDIIDNAPTVEIATKLQPNCNQSKASERRRRMTNEEAIRELKILKAESTTELTENALDLAIKALEERPQGEWIPVSERLPNDRDWYLGVFKEPDTDFIGIPYICDYVGEVTKGTTNEGWILRHCTDVNTVSDYFRNLICVAWQPLPEPHKEGGAE